MRPCSEAIGLPAIQRLMYQPKNKTLKMFLKVLHSHLLVNG